MLMCDAVNTHTVCQVGCKWRSTAVSHVHAKLPNCCQPRPVSFLPDKQCNLRGRHTDEWKAQVNEKNCFLRKLVFSLLSALVHLQHILLYISICTWLHLKVRFFTCFSTAQSCGQFSGICEHVTNKNLNLTKKKYVCAKYFGAALVRGPLKDYSKFYFPFYWAFKVIKNILH